MLRVVNIKKTFAVDQGEQVNALKGVSIEVPNGEFFTLLGPSGSGKSTAMRCIAGLEHPDEGEIYIGEQCVFSSKRKIMVPPDERPIGMVFQSYAIWPHMDVFHNVAFPLMYGSSGPKPSKEEIRNSVDEALKLVQLAGYGDRPATQLSGGQQQRVALARAIVRRPRLLLLDEPLSNLDAKLREEMRVEMKEMTTKLGMTSFFVTHDQIEALALSDRIAVIMQGEIVEMGKPHEVYTRSENKLVAAFLGTTNTLEGLITGTGSDTKLETEIGALTLGARQTMTSSGRASVAIRPEAVDCLREKPRDGANVYQGTVKRTMFLGTFIDGEVQIGSKSLRVSFNPYNTFSPGEKVYVHIPPERCQLIH